MMKKKFIALMLAAGAAYTAAKLITRRKAEKNKTPRNDIYDAFQEASFQRDNGDITEEEYREILNAIRNKAAARGETTVNDLLEEAYFEAVYAADCHAALMVDVEDTDASSLEDFIERFPDKAYENGVLGLNEYGYEEQARETADYIAKKYYQELNKTESRLFEYVEMLGGDTKNITQEFDKIRENSIK